MAWLQGLRERLRALLCKGRVERELDEELRFHLEREEERFLRRGMSPVEARRAARISLGGVESVKERVRDERGGRWLEDLAKDLGFALRTLRRSPVFTATAVLTLALGIGVNAAVFSVIDGVLLRPLPWPDSQRLVAIWTTFPERGQSRSVGSPHDIDDWATYNHTFDGISAFSSTWSKISAGAHPEMVRHARVIPGFFAVVGLPPALGRGFVDAERDPDRIRVAVISHGLWQSRFGGRPEVLGESLRLNDESLEIVGVAAPGFDLPATDTAVWTPLERPLAGISRSSYWAFALGRLKPSVSLQEASADLGDIMARLAEIHPENEGLGVRLETLLEVIVGEVRPTLWMLWGSVGLVLLIACANVAHLLLARATGRGREIAIRTSLGAGRGRVVRQLLAESLALALIGGAGGLGLAALAVRLLPDLAADMLPRVETIALDGRALAFTFTVAVLTGLLFGTLPALRATRLELTEALKEGGRQAAGGSAGRSSWQALIVIGETAAAVVVLVAAALLLRSFEALVHVEPGFRSERLLAVRLSPAKQVQFDGDEATYRAAYELERDRMRRFFGEIRGRIASLPGVEGVALTNFRPLAGSAWGVRLQVEGGPELKPTELPTARSRVVEPGYFRTLGIRLLAGRTFADADHGADGGVAILSDSTARQLWPGADALGKRFSFRDGQWVTVIGIVDEVHDKTLEDAASPTIYSPFNGATYGFHDTWTMDLLIRAAGDPTAQVEPVRAEIAAVAPDLPLTRVETMSEALRDSTAARRFTTILLGVFGVLALILAAIGLYGVLAYTVSRRTHDYGVRMALGALRGDVFGLVIGRGMVLAGIGLGVGLGVAAVLTRFLGSLLYQVRPTDMTSFVAAASILLIIAGVACLVPAWRATRVDPISALRYE